MTVKEKQVPSIKTFTVPTVGRRILMFIPNVASVHICHVEGTTVSPPLNSPKQSDTMQHPSVSFAHPHQEPKPRDDLVVTGHKPGLLGLLPDQAAESVGRLWSRPACA